MAQISSNIFRHWIHSHEEDIENVRVYRPSDFKFPLSRGREGFEIKRNGEFISYDISASNGIDTVKGKWYAEDPTSIIITYKNTTSKNRKLHIIHVSDSVLKLKRYVIQ
jgi:hypothetical protein